MKRGIIATVALALVPWMAVAGAQREKAEEKPALIVGATYVGTVNDAGYNQAQKEGLEVMKKNVPGIKLLEAENVPESAEAERVMENMIQQGAKLIFATSFGHMDPALNVAKRHPDVVFQHSGGYKLAPNFGTYYAKMQVAWYPMGVAAGKMTKTNKLGFIIGLPLGFSLGNVNAFQLGARSVNPNVETRVVVTGGWVDRAKEAAAANALADQGVDVITMHVDSPVTIIQTAEARGVMSIGFQSTESRKFAPKGWISGLGFTWGDYMTEVAKATMAGTFKSGHVRRGIEENMIGVAPFGPSVSVEVQKATNDAIDKLKKGFNPFTGPIKDQKGVVQIKEGETWGNEKMGEFKWFVEGVVGEPK